MTRDESPFRKLMEIDATLPLAVAALVFCAIGFVYGTGTAFRAVAYGFIGLFAIGMPLLLFYGWHAELEQLRDIQQQYGGRLKRSWLLGGPSLNFAYAGTRAVVRLIRRHQKYRPDDMQIELDWPGTRLRLEVRPQGVLSTLGRLVGIQDIKVGRAGFDDAYVVQGDDAAQVRRLLTRDVQQQIAALPEQKYLAIRLDLGRLVVRAQHYSLESNLSVFMEAVMRLYDALKDSDKAD